MMMYKNIMGPEKKQILCGYMLTVCSLSTENYV